MRLRWLLCSAAVLPVMGALAQQAPKPVERVEVAGSRPAVQSLPDRQIYLIDRDMQSASGSATDVLKNLPSVEVDVQGTVSLRGDANVTILIDGKPSAMLAGSDALEQIPAESIAQIEVITNPSAQYRREGSGGIINIVMRKDADPGRSGSLRASAGNEGRYTASASGSAKFGRYSLSGNLSYRRDKRWRTGETERQGIGAESQTTSDKMRREGVLLRSGAEAELDESNAFEAGFFAFAGNAHHDGVEHNVSRAGGSETRFDRFTVGSGKRRGLQGELSFTHAFPRKGAELKLQVQRGHDWDSDNHYITGAWPDDPNAATTREELLSKETESETEASADFVLPFAGGAKFKAGYEYEDEQNEYDNLGRLLENSGWVINPDFTSRFIVDQAVHAGYASFEDKFGKLTALAGLRLEGTSITAEQRTMGVTNKDWYLDLYPSLHLTYDIGDGQELRMSYSRRINRPSDHDINPSLEYRDAFNVSSGNPRLKPENTDSIEAAYKYTGDSLDGLVTAYYRRTRNGFTDVSRYISPTVLLTTRENLAHRVQTGLEASINGDIGKTLAFRISGNGFYNEIDPGPASIGRFRSGLAWSGKLNLDYKLTANDLVQLGFNYGARQFSAQGYRLPEFTANAGYRHTFSPGFAAVFTANNLFDSFKNKTVLDSGAVTEVSTRRMKGPMLFAGLVYSFGERQQEDRQGDGDGNGYGNGDGN